MPHKWHGRSRPILPSPERSGKLWKLGGTPYVAAGESAAYVEALSQSVQHMARQPGSRRYCCEPIGLYDTVCLTRTVHFPMLHQSRRSRIVAMLLIAASFFASPADDSRAQPKTPLEAIVDAHLYFPDTVGSRWRYRG